MNLRKVILLIITVAIICSSISMFAFRIRMIGKIDIVAVNDIAQILVEHWDELAQEEDSEKVQESEYGKVLNPYDLLGIKYGMDFVVIDNENNLVQATRRGLNENLNGAIKNRDTIIDIKREDEVLGKLIIYNDSNEKLQQYRDELFRFTCLIIITVALLCILFAVYYDRTIFRPFRKLQSFARHVAEGNLDIPLEMDPGNMFGAFTESFDLMRDEIKLARENERKANQSKKELVASLSHDIKTPVASIKAVSELMYARSEDETIKKQADVINTKADQINTLITNLFNATLEELQELKVDISEQSSLVLYELIDKADYNKQVTITKVIECLILSDELRLAQVIDNVISNSYKYAGTSIEVSTQIRGKYLEVVFKDFGQGVAEDEKPLIFNKFYRAKNAANKSGTGLGLYISKYIMNKMSGEIDCINYEDGFAIILKLKIA